MVQNNGLIKSWELKIDQLMMMILIMRTLEVKIMTMKKEIKMMMIKILMKIMIKHKYKKMLKIRIQIYRILPTLIVKIKDTIVLIGEEQMILFIQMVPENRRIKIKRKILLLLELYQKFKKKLKIMLPNKRRE